MEKPPDTAPKVRPSLSTISKRSKRKPSHISKVLNGRPCRLETAADIAKAMDITIDELYDRYIKNGGWGFR